MSKHYHAHVYFQPDESTLAREVASNLLNTAPGLELAGVVGHKVGPHPLPMIEFHLSETTIAPLRAALMLETRIKSTLIHEDTGDDYKDHTTGAEWVGQKLDLDFGFFDLIQRDPDRRIHK